MRYYDRAPDHDDGDEPRQPRPAPIVVVRPTHTITERPWNDGSSVMAYVQWNDPLKGISGQWFVKA